MEKLPYGYVTKFGHVPGQNQHQSTKALKNLKDLGSMVFLQNKFQCPPPIICWELEEPKGPKGPQRNTKAPKQNGRDTDG